MDIPAKMTTCFAFMLAAERLSVNELVNFSRRAEISSSIARAEVYNENLNKRLQDEFISLIGSKGQKKLFGSVEALYLRYWEEDSSLGRKQNLYFTLAKTLRSR